MTDECKAILEFIACDYELLSSNMNQREIVERFNALAKLGKTDRFCPLIIAPSDTLAESLEFFAEDNDIENTRESIAAYRQTIIEAASKVNASVFLSSQVDIALKDYNDGNYDILGQFIESEPSNTLILNMLENASIPEIILAKIPTENPWELAAWMPMGGFNECPTPTEQVAVFRYWHEKHGAVPAVVAFDTWEMALVKPPLTEEDAEVLAKEHFAFCRDIVEQGTETIRNLASTLKNSTAWFFWWD